MATVTADTAVKLSHNWGVSFSDYRIDGTQVDFQDLMIAIAENRATTVEGEVAPLTTRIKARNAKLEKLGTVLAELTKLQSQFDNESTGWSRVGSLTQPSYDILKDIFGTVNFTRLDMAKCEVEEWLQKCKSKIDGLNNEAQTDMTRLQSLVDRRDEAFSTATTLMTSISDTRSNLINNL